MAMHGALSCWPAQERPPYRPGLSDAAMTAESLAEETRTLDVGWLRRTTFGAGHARFGIDHVGEAPDSADTGTEATITCSFPRPELTRLPAVTDNETASAAALAAYTGGASAIDDLVFRGRGNVRVANARDRRPTGPPPDQAAGRGRAFADHP